MKVVYDWLKEFVDVPVSAEELASRLALTGTNIGGVENGPHGAVIDAEVTSNRPDCLGHLGIAREVSAIYKLALKICRPPKLQPAAAGTRVTKCARRHSGAGALREIHGAGDSRE